ncbi:sterile alpha motif domain-containing protein 1-like [Loxodonta africana]|uniref:sterile alpha motif domain-containing protein 1-like n=1 Tax=Loxodonta africana TaxID=9785 RepID=UPI0005406238|nr:atherin-like [Loxodonta africana]
MPEPKSGAGRRPLRAAADGGSCARERRLPPRQLGGARGSRWDHLFPAPAGSAERAARTAPPPPQLAPSQRPLQTGRRRRCRLSRRRRRRACAPHARTPAWTPPPRPPARAITATARTAPPPTGPRPPATPTPRRRSQANGLVREAPMVQLRGAGEGGGGERSEVIGCLQGIPVGPQSPIGYCPAFAGLGATKTPLPPPPAQLCLLVTQRGQGTGLARRSLPIVG